MTEVAPAPDAPPTEAEALDAYSRTVTDVARRLLPCVASLRVGSGQRRGEGAGSAVTITPDGFLVTSAHVVAGGRNGQATLVDGQEFDFEVVGADALSDLAVIRAHGRELPTATLGDADALQVGQLVVAVGNPLGLAGSALVGSAMPAVAASVPIVHVQKTDISTGTKMYHHA